MEDYFKRAKIDNPMNVKRVTGEIPTIRSSNKNMIVILVTFLVLGLTFTRVWNIALYYIKSPVWTGIILGIIYALIVAKVLSVTIFEEKKQKKAYKDLLDNKMSNLSVIWEVQDIVDTEVSGEKIAYIDYIDGRRTTLLRCVPGSILNKDEDAPAMFYSNLQNVLETIDNLGLSYDYDIIEESIGDDKALNYYYDSLADYNDMDFVEVFTEILDTIKYVGDTRSAIYVLYIEIIGSGKFKHKMLENVSHLPNLLRNNTIFYDVNFIRDRASIDRWIARNHGVSMFDREELIMNKYRNSTNLGVTSVLAAYDFEGNIVKKFNPDFNPAKIVKKKSIDLHTDIVKPNNTLTEETMTKLREVGVTIEGSDSGIKIGELSDTKHKKFIELMYSKDKVKLG